jgi:hypothetical protein
MTQTTDAPAAQQQGLHPDTYATISLFCALIGLGLPAVVFGHIAYANDGTRTGNMMAVFGFVAGYIEIAFTLLFLIALATS